MAWYGHPPPPADRPCLPAFLPYFARVVSVTPLQESRPRPCQFLGIQLRRSWLRKPTRGRHTFAALPSLPLGTAAFWIEEFGVTSRSRRESSREKVASRARFVHLNDKIERDSRAIADSSATRTCLRRNGRDNVHPQLLYTPATYYYWLLLTTVATTVACSSLPLVERNVTHTLLLRNFNDGISSLFVHVSGRHEYREAGVVWTDGNELYLLTNAILWKLELCTRRVKTIRQRGNRPREYFSTRPTVWKKKSLDDKSIEFFSQFVSHDTATFCEMRRGWGRGWEGSSWWVS